MEKAEARMKAWRQGDWRYIGIRARATIYVPIGGNSFAVYTLSSPGLWGVESDSGDYLDETFEEEKATLTDHLKTIGEYYIVGDGI